VSGMPTRAGGRVWALTHPCRLIKYAERLHNFAH
jgi:hypothetical protein